MLHFIVTYGVVAVLMGAPGRISVSTRRVSIRVPKSQS